MAKKTLLKRRASRKKKKGSSKRNKPKILLAVFAVAALLIVLQIANSVKRGAQNIEVKAKVVSQFSGDDKACGNFGAWDVTSVGNDRIVVSDQANGRLLFFDRQGNFLRSVGKKGEGKDDFKEICSLTCDNRENVYVIDSWGSSIRGYRTSGKKTLDIRLIQNFFGPRGLAWDKGYFFVADTGTHRIAKISEDGQLAASWGGKKGSGKQNLDNPRAVAVDSKGQCYVADYENARIQVINSSNGEFLRALDVDAKPNEVAVDSKDRLWVASSEGRFLKLYDPSGKFLGKVVNADGSPNTFGNISGLCATPDGALISTSGNRVMEFRVVEKP
jgi:DNA-binding beta-propeller fold protein YncE